MKAFYTLILILLAGTAYGQSNSQAALSESCSFFDKKIRFSKDEKLCINSKSLLFNQRGLIPGENRTYLEVIQSSRTYSVAVSTDPMMCPFVSGIAFNWGGVVDSQKAIEFCQKKLSESKSTNCACETLLDSGISLLSREQFDRRVELLERQILGSRLALSSPEQIRESGLGKEQKAQNDLSITEERQRLAQERQRLLEKEKLLETVPRRQMEEERKKRETAKTNAKMELSITATEPDSNGLVILSIQTGVDTSSLKINGDEQGGKSDGSYSVKRVARVGQETKFVLAATDVYGNTDSKTITVVRLAVEPKAVFSQLNAANIKQQPARDAVAIIIGIEKYKRVAKADFANADAQDFYDYASRALGIKPVNIKLLIDDGADDVEILQAFQNWLPLKVKKGITDVYVFFSGHGYPSEDGKGLYFLPYGVDKNYLDRTAVKQKEVINALQSVQPKSVTMFIDSCYSGQTRGGETLVAGSRPIALKQSETAYPPEFTVITASTMDQISWSSPDLKHGLFSYYLMKGMEGDSDLNKDGKVTVAEMQEYLTDMVGRHAMGMNRNQQPQLFGDPNKVLIFR